MIKKSAGSAVLLCLASVPFLWSAAPPPGQSRLAEVYKAGPIRLTPDPAFGKNTDWNLLFYHLFCDLTVAPDGSIFIASSRQHKIFKFDPAGNLIKTFGQKGQGPGDFNGPDNLSVLDGKYLVIGEYGLSHRISIFDLEGNFKQVLKTERPPYSPVALREGKIAYIVHNHRGEGPADMKTIDSVVIRNIDGTQEKEVARFTFNMPSIMLRRAGSIRFGDGISGEAFIAATKAGNLLVGNSLQTFFDVYSPEGVKLSTIDLDIEPILVTRDYRVRYRDYNIEQMRQDPQFSQGPAKEMGVLKEVEKASIDHVFADTLPLYREVLTDAEGNLLVFKRTECLGECPILIRVYSPEGEFVCETEVQEGSFRLGVDPRIKNMVFGREGLIAMVEVKDAEDFALRVIRVNYN